MSPPDNIRHFYPYDYINRRCFVCGCLLRFFPLRPPDWFVGLACLGCGYENVAHDTPLPFDQAQALAQYLSAESQSAEAQEEARHWEVSAARLRKQEARAFRKCFLRRFPQYRDCLRVPSLDAPELLVLASEHPHRTESLTVRLRLYDTNLAWGNVRWSHLKHPRTLPCIIDTLAAILSEQLLITDWYRQGRPYCTGRVRRGEALRLPYWEASLEEVHLFSWRGTYDRVLQHPQQTGGILSP